MFQSQQLEAFLSYFHTIKSILNLEHQQLLLLQQLHFHTIKSILDNIGFVLILVTSKDFHTIKSILNLPNWVELL